MNSNQIRSTFLNYFKKNGHEIIHSSSLVPDNDPTLMFANSGMVQFKNIFTGKETRDYKRATTAQKCVRAGGKHNDLENVGYTTCLLYTSPSPRDATLSRMPSSA